MIDGKDIFRKLVQFIEDVPQAFPPRSTKSWSPTFTAFFYTLGRQEGYEPRCGDYHKKLENMWRERGFPPLPGGYADVVKKPWKNVHGLLDIDVAWVPKGFSIPKDFLSFPEPKRAEIYLAYEHEDEGTMYTDIVGTNLTVILDEVRKIGNVRSRLKVLSYISSQTEIENDSHVGRIRKEIERIPLTEELTKQWLIVAFGKYQSLRNGKKPIMSGSQRQLVCKGVLLDEQRNEVHRETKMVKYPA